MGKERSQEMARQMISRIYNIITEKNAFYETCIHHGLNLGQAYNIRKDAMKFGTIRVECSIDDSGNFDAQPRLTSR